MTLHTGGRSTIEQPRQRKPLPLSAILCLLPVLAFPFHAFSELRLNQIVVPAVQTTQEQAATQMLAEESGRRTSANTAAKIQPGPVEQLELGTAAVVLALRSTIPTLLPSQILPAWRSQLSHLAPNDRPEGFAVLTLPWHGSAVIVIAGNDARGELFGAGWLLRQMRFASGHAEIPANLNTFQSPDKPVRGHQIGYRFKNNTYDAWTLPQFEQQIRDLAIFGANTIQLIAPVSDDRATSPLNPAPPLETLLGISAILNKYGLACDLYYPEMRPDYADPDQAAAELRDFEALVRAMPQLDALYIPGGDPGHTAPQLVFPLVAREAAILHRYHPKATVWVSAQGFDRAAYEQFYALLAEHPAWLTGVFFGPQSRDSFFIQRRRIPARYAMQFYPDIAHTMHAQFPVPQWDPIFALTEGREPICPRPEAFAAIYKHFAALHSGFVTYSEGVNDDVNKILWSQLGWSASTPVDQVLAEYARFFLHREGPQQQLAVAAIHGLERNWNGPIATSTQIARTRELFAQLEAHKFVMLRHPERSTLQPHRKVRSRRTPRTLASLPQLAAFRQREGNGRWESLLYRANYDDFLQRKLIRERSAEASALAALTNARLTTAQERVAAANAFHPSSTPSEEETREHDQLFLLASELFHDWGLQLSVNLYGASNVERGANLDRVDTPLTEEAWLERAMASALEKPDEAARLKALAAITDWRGTSLHALYDDLGDPTAQPHLVRGPSPSPSPETDPDPEMYHTAIDGIADRTLADGWRLSWLDYAETLYETPLELRYTKLDPAKHYRVRVTYAGEDYALPLQLSANGIEVHPARLRSANPETVEFPIPSFAIGNHGLELNLQLKWTGPSGSGGSGRGRQVAEVWLIPQ